MCEFAFVNALIWLNILGIWELYKEVKCLQNDIKKDKEFEKPLPFCNEEVEVKEEIYDEGYVQDMDEFNKRIEYLKSVGGEEYND